ncbi:MAG TPA: lytic murein transglycosylase [Pseudolabrys sp.]|nr:lytic murein transglycosylase [Pseudolabrys sp.]
MRAQNHRARAGSLARKTPIVLLAALLTVAATAAAAQVTGSIPPDSRTATPPWSGQSGASGDPRMSASAVRADAAHFAGCLAGLWPAAARRGVSRGVFLHATRGLTPDLHIMDLLDSQPAFTKSIWDYLDILVTGARIAKGRALLDKYSDTFTRAERTYGVSRYIIAAIWGVESNYGEQVGDRPVLRSTATLACVGRRQHYFRHEFLATLEILQHHDVPQDRLVGSWAGAFGPTQFMPTAFLRYAVDFDSDGRRDVVDSAADLIGSTANNLKKDGWASGETWGYEVVVPATLDFIRVAGHSRLSIAEWQKLGIVRAGGKRFPHPHARAFLLMPAGIQGPGFLILHNFRVIMRYNPSEAYALAIGHLADRLRGGGPFVQAWPRYEKVLSRGDRFELQELLERHGFDVGEPDGLIGARTRDAIRGYQARIGRIPDGFASASLLKHLRAQ